MLNTIFSALGVMVLIGGGYIVLVLLSMVFNSDISEFKSKFNNEYEMYVNDLEVVEISNNEKALPYEFNSDTGEIEGSSQKTLSDDGAIADVIRFFSGDPEKSVEVLLREGNSSSLVFKKNEVYEFDGYKLGSKVGEFSNPALDLIRHVMPVNEKYVLVNGDRINAPYADPYLWQVEVKTLKKEILTEDPFFSHSRPPKIFIPDGYNGVVIVYYVGSYSFGYGGGSSVPKFSVIRVYNNKYHEGKDIAKFAYKAGTIVDARWEKDALILTGDPSKPDGKKSARRPARVWKIGDKQELTDVL